MELRPGQRDVLTGLLQPPWVQQQPQHVGRRVRVAGPLMDQPRVPPRPVTAQSFIRIDGSTYSLVAMASAVSPAGTASRCAV